MYPEMPDIEGAKNAGELVLFLYPGPKAASLDRLLSGKCCDFDHPTEQKSKDSIDKVRRTQVRLILVDASWKGAKQISRSVLKQEPLQVQIADRDTVFWRYQTGLSNKHLATIEVS